MTSFVDCSSVCKSLLKKNSIAAVHASCYMESIRVPSPILLLVLLMANPATLCGTFIAFHLVILQACVLEVMTNMLQLQYFRSPSVVVQASRY